jgi:hypothetical protein
VAGVQEDLVVDLEVVVQQKLHQQEVQLVQVGSMAHQGLVAFEVDLTVGSVEGSVVDEEEASVEDLVIAVDSAIVVGLVTVVGSVTVVASEEVSATAVVQETALEHQMAMALALRLPMELRLDPEDRDETTMAEVADLEGVEDQGMMTAMEVGAHTTTDQLEEAAAIANQSAQPVAAAIKTVTATAVLDMVETTGNEGMKATTTKTREINEGIEVCPSPHTMVIQLLSHLIFHFTPSSSRVSLTTPANLEVHLQIHLNQHLLHLFY